MTQISLDLINTETDKAVNTMNLLSGEEIKSISSVASKSNSISDKEINDSYLKGEIRIVTEQARYPLDTIPNLLNSGKYNLNPEYQRRKRWSIQQKSRLIESFIINVPIPPIFLYEVNYAEYEVMDGLQRLTSIKEFYDGDFRLEGLEQWPELNGRTYQKLPEKIREGIDRRYLSSIVLLNETAKTPEQADFLKQVVFGRLNSGGDKLTAQESRNALYSGKFNALCIELSKNDNFRKLYGFTPYEFSNGILINESDLLKDDSYRKMEDVELVLRFFAYRQYQKLSSYNSQEKFLDDFLNQANRFNDNVLAELIVIFEKTVEIIYHVFGESAFYMPDGEREKTTPTKTVYDPLMHSISKVLDKETLILSKSTELRDNKYTDKALLKKPNKERNNDLFDGKYNSKADVEARVNYFDNYIDSILKS